MKIKEMIDTVKLVEEFKETMKKYPISERRLCKEIGICRLSIKSFLNEPNKTHLRSLLKIEQWIRNKNG